MFICLCRHCRVEAIAKRGWSECGLTGDDVDVGAAPEQVAASPLGGLSDEADGAVAALKVFGDEHLVGLGRGVAFDEGRAVAAHRQVEDGLLAGVQHLDAVAAPVRIAQVPGHVERRAGQNGRPQGTCNDHRDLSVRFKTD